MIIIPCDIRSYVTLSNILLEKNIILTCIALLCTLIGLYHVDT